MKQRFDTNSGSYVVSGYWYSDWVHFNGVRYMYQPFAATTDIQQVEYYTAVEFAADGVLGKYLHQYLFNFHILRFKSFDS
jgi:hypothetical protein